MVFPVIYTAQNYNLIGSLRSGVLPSYTGQLLSGSIGHRTEFKRQRGCFTYHRNLPT